MSVKKLLVAVIVGLVLVATLIAVLGLVHELTDGAPFDLRVHNLELWVREIAYRLAIIVLAATGVYYLVNKK